MKEGKQAQPKQLPLKGIFISLQGEVSLHCIQKNFKLCSFVKGSMCLPNYAMCNQCLNVSPFTFSGSKVQTP